MSWAMTRLNSRTNPSSTLTSSSSSSRSRETSSGNSSSTRSSSPTRARPELRTKICGRRTTGAFSRRSTRRARTRPTSTSKPWMRRRSRTQPSPTPRATTPKSPTKVRSPAKLSRGPRKEAFSVHRPLTTLLSNKVASSEEPSCPASAPARNPLAMMCRGRECQEGGDKRETRTP